MKKTLRILTVVLAMAMLLGLVACGAQPPAAQQSQGSSQATPALAAEPAPKAEDEAAPAPEKSVKKIGVIQFVEHAALDAAYQGFVAALAENGYVDGDNISIDYQNGQADTNNLSTISDRFVSNKVDLVLAIATPAAQAIAGKTKDIPILATAVTSFVSAGLVQSDEAPGYNVSGASDLNPVKAQIELVKKLVPDVKTIGFIYNSSEDNSVLQINMAKQACDENGLAYTEVTVTNQNDVQQALSSLVKKCDAVYVPTDNVIAASMPTVYGVAVESKTPVICGESNMVNSGGLATMGINYYDLGYQTGIMALDILKDGADVSKMPVQYAKNSNEIQINGDVAKDIGLDIPEDLKAYVVYPSDSAGQ